MNIQDSTVLNDPEVLNEAIGHLEAIASLLTAHRHGWHLSTAMTLETICWTLRHTADRLETAKLIESPQADDDEPEGEWISVKVPILDGGGGTIRTFDVLAVSDPEDCHLRGMSLYDSEMSADAAMNVLRGWRFVLDGNGNPIEFSRDNLAAMFLSWPLLGSRIAKAIKQNREQVAYGK